MRLSPLVLSDDCLCGNHESFPRGLIRTLCRVFELVLKANASGFYVRCSLYYDMQLTVIIWRVCDDNLRHA